MAELFTYDLIARDPSTQARAGVFHTAHGDICTPTFMPVGTKATVKAVTKDQLISIGAQIILANTYHLAMRPGADLIAQMGGLHAWEHWDKPILTDSGGFQVFSLAENVKLTKEGVGFRALDYDGSKFFWTPEKNMEIAQKLGSDICMQLDICCGYPVSHAQLVQSVDFSARWAEQCWQAHTLKMQALFGIVQGGMDYDLRCESIERLENVGDFPGYGIGGYSVGEDHATMFETLVPLLKNKMPQHKPRYLMGVGNPATLVKAVGAGVDLFDCVLPTRTARMGSALSSQGRMNMKNARYKMDEAPLDEQCTCPVCSEGYPRSYVHHLVRQHEIVGATLLSIHNLYYLIHLMDEARAAVCEGRYVQFERDFLASPAAERDF